MPSKARGGDPRAINPKCRVDLVVDHSVAVDTYGSAEAHAANVAREFERNRERYTFLKWGQQAFDNFRVVPPGNGICHQVNIEKLAGVVWAEPSDGETYTLLDTVVGTDSHTTMVNALGVLGWGVGGIEAEAAMLGQPISMLIPEVIGVELKGTLPSGVFATDLVLTIAERLRNYGVVGKFVEFYGPGVRDLSLEGRATIANMSPEFGATCAFFPIDDETCRYLSDTGRAQEQVDCVRAYAKAQGIWHDPEMSPSRFTDTITIDLDHIQACVAGPKRPQDKVTLSDMPSSSTPFIREDAMPSRDFDWHSPDRGMTHGDVVIAAITSCTNTSNPEVLIAAALLAKRAIESGLQTKSWVKTSFAPGSKVVVGYLQQLGLLTYLEQLGFYLVGYGCTTCIGNSGPLRPDIEAQINQEQLMVSAVLSGNRNFEGRIHPLTKTNWLASPPLVVAYALMGTTLLDITEDPLGRSADGALVYLADIWPSTDDIAPYMAQINKGMFIQEYATLFDGDAAWQDIAITAEPTFNWDETSSYIRKPAFFADSNTLSAQKDIQQAAILALLGDSVTTDHISPAGAIQPSSAAGAFLQEKGIAVADFNSYGARRGNHQVMTRGTFANIRLRNEMVEQEGGFTRYQPTGESMYLYDCAYALSTGWSCCCGDCWCGVWYRVFSRLGG